MYERPVLFLQWLDIFDTVVALDIIHMESVVFETDFSKWLFKNERRVVITSDVLTASIQIRQSKALS